MRHDPSNPLIILADTDELEELDNSEFMNAFANAAGNIPQEYPHASSETNVGKYYWRAALAYERSRKK